MSFQTTFSSAALNKVPGAAQIRIETVVIWLPWQLWKTNTELLSPPTHTHVRVCFGQLLQDPHPPRQVRVHPPPPQAQPTPPSPSVGFTSCLEQSGSANRDPATGPSWTAPYMDEDGELTDAASCRLASPCRSGHVRVRQMRWRRLGQTLAVNFERLRS